MSTNTEFNALIAVMIDAHKRMYHAMKWCLIGATVAIVGAVVAILSAIGGRCL